MYDTATQTATSTPELHLISDNSPLTLSQLRTASEICQQAVESVKARDADVKAQQLDSEFALPAANWSYDAPNEFVRVFRRLAQCDPTDIAHLRGFSQVFSGYNLYRTAPGAGLTTFNMEFGAGFDAALQAGLEQRNGPFVEEWKRLTKGLPPEAILRPAAMLGEVGHEIDGVIINNDTCTYQERVNLIVQSGLLAWLKARGPNLRICEIGGGYGALCRWFLSALPGVSYTIIDLPESLIFSQIYVTLSCPEGVAQFIPNYQAERLKQPFDLVINTLSMSEMSEYQVRTYLRFMKTRWLQQGGIFFEQNQNNLHMGLLAAEDIIATELPHRKKLREGATLRNGSPNLWSLEPINLHEKPSTWRRLIRSFGA